MAQDRIVRTLQFTAIAPGVPTSLPHGLVNSQGKLKPNALFLNAGGFTATYDDTNVTVTNTGGAPASVGVMALAFHSVQLELGGDAGLSIPVFVVSGGGGSGSGKYDSRINAVTDGSMAPDGVTNNVALWQPWLNQGIGFQLYAPGGVYKATLTGTPTPQVFIVAGATRAIWGDGPESSVFKFTVAAGQTYNFYTQAGGTLTLSEVTVQGLNSGIISQGQAIFSEAGGDVTLFRAKVTGTAYVKMDGSAGAGTSTRFRSYLVNHDYTGVGEVGGTAPGCLSLTSDDAKPATAHIIGSRFSMNGVANPPTSFAHDIYLEYNVALLAVGCDFIRAFDDTGGNGYGIHHNDDPGTVTGSPYSLVVGCTFAPAVGNQILPNPLQHTMVLGCGFTTGVGVGGGGIGLRARGKTAAIIGSTMNGVGQSCIDDFIGVNEATVTVVGSFLEGSPTVAALNRTASAATGLWRIVATDIAITTGAADAYGLVQASGETEVAFSSFVQSSTFGTDASHARIRGGTLAMSFARVVGERNVWLECFAADVVLQTDHSIYAAPLTTGDGLLVKPTANRTITVRGYGSRFTGGNFGPHVDLTAAPGATVVGQMRPPGGDESQTISVGKAATITCNTDFVRLRGANDLQTIKMSGSDTSDANGPLRLFTGFRLTIWVDTTGFTVAAGGNIAASSLAIGAHAAGTTFVLTLVDQLWY